MNRSQALFLDTRQLALERDAKIVAARSLGLGVIVAVPEPGAYTDWLVDEVLIVPLHDPPAAEALILDGLAARHVDPVAVVAWSDGEAELAARLGVRLGLRALCPAAAINVGNKIQTRRCLQRVPFGNPRFAVVRTEPEFLEALTAVGIPSVLRAADARDGRGPSRITDPQTALATFRRFRDAYHPRDQPTGSARSDEVLLEEILIGSVHSVVGIVRDSRIHVLAVADKRYDVLPLPQQSTVPSRLPLTLKTTVIDLARAAVAAVDIDHCGFHVDVGVTSQGPRVFEVQARLDGECISSHLIPRVMAPIRPYELLLQGLMGDPPLARDDYSADASARAAFRRLLPPRAGHITRLEGLEAAARHPNTQVLCPLRGVGDLVPDPQDGDDAFTVAYVIAECDLDHDIDAMLDDITARIHVGVASDGAR